MHSLTTAAMLALLGASTLASAAAPTKINIQGVLRETPGGPIFLKVAAGDVDGDGISDEAVIKLICVGGELEQALYTVKGPRDSASGQATGKRQHGPVTFVKEWGAATPQLSAMRATWDLKTNSHVRMAARSHGWIPIILTDAAGLCAAAAEATKTVPKTSSNIQNN